MTANIPASSILKRGFLLGAFAGGVLSVAYTTIVIPLVGMLIVFINIPAGKVFDALLGAGFFAICAWPFAIVMGILPGILIGAIGGFLTGSIVVPLRTRISSKGAAFIGLIVAIGAVIGGHILFFPGLIDINSPGFHPYFPFLFWLACPSVLILTGLTWVGWLLLGWPYRR